MFYSHIIFLPMIFNFVLCKLFPSVSLSFRHENKYYKTFQLINAQKQMLETFILHSFTTLTPGILTLCFQLYTL